MLISRQICQKTKDTSKIAKSGVEAKNIVVFTRTTVNNDE